MIRLQRPKPPAPAGIANHADLAEAIRAMFDAHDRRVRLLAASHVLWVIAAFAISFRHPAFGPLTAGFFGAGNYLFIRRMKKALKARLDEIERSDDPDLVLALARGRPMLRLTSENPLDPALIRLLPHLPVERLESLDKDEATALAGLLSTHNVDLVLAALPVVAHLHTPGAVAAAERLEKDPMLVLSPSLARYLKENGAGDERDDVRQVAAATRACLAALRAWEAEDRARQTLLRASQPAPQAALVRPAGATMPEAGQLLRASEEAGE